MKIYNKHNELILDVEVDDSSYHYRELCGEQYVELNFSLADYVDIPTMSYIDMDNERYTLLTAANITMEHKRNYAYKVRFEAQQSLLSMYIFRNTVDGRLKFPLTAKPMEHLQMLVDCLNANGGKWRIGGCIIGDEITISYNFVNCLEALQMMAQEADTEWEIRGNDIFLRRVVYMENQPLALSYGNGLLPGIERNNVNDAVPLAIAYVQGGERNIDLSRYGASTLHLPKGKTIKYDGRYFEDEAGYDGNRGVEYVTSPDGLAVRRMLPLTNIGEGYVDCSEIYPHREGEVTEVIAVNAASNLYDIKDDTIPEALDYNDYQIAGTAITIVFQSGMLAGREFDATYNHTSRRFAITAQVYDGLTMPGGDFVPQVGDKYAVYNVSMPDAYIADDATKSGAEWDAFRKVVRHLAEHEKQQYSLSLKLDKAWMRLNWATAQAYMLPGALVAFSNEAFQTQPLDIRVASVTHYLSDRYSYSITLWDGVDRQSYKLTVLRSEAAIANIQLSANKAVAISKQQTLGASALIPRVTVLEKRADDNDKSITEIEASLDNTIQMVESADNTLIGVNVEDIDNTKTATISAKTNTLGNAWLLDGVGSVNGLATAQDVYDFLSARLSVKIIS